MISLSLDNLADVKAKKGVIISLMLGRKGVIELIRALDASAADGG